MTTAFFDIDTQLDFLYPAGALYVPGAERIVPRVAALNRMAALKGIPVVSTVDAHAENDPEFGSWPPHCIAGTHGQMKPASTLLETRAVIPNRPGDLPSASLQQYILEKQSVDSFRALQLHALLKLVGAERCVVYGVVTEVCVRHAALGLLRTGRKVELVTDAIRHLNEAARDSFMAEFKAAGGTLITFPSL